MTESEIGIVGYETHTNLTKDEGRGIAVYTRVSLCTRDVSLLSAFQESMWISIKLKDTDQLLIGCIYRSPNSERQNNEEIQTLLRAATDNNHSHILVVGDFNHPHTDWIT